MARDTWQRKTHATGQRALALAALLGAATLPQVAQAEQSGLGSAGARGARWQQGTVTVSVEDSVDLVGDAAFEAVVMAASAWQESPAELPTLVVQHGPEDPVGYRSGGHNRNTVRYSPDGDPMAGGALAITVITFDAQAKRILDADIVLNGEYEFGFFSGDGLDSDTDKYDLQNVLTHELGHLLGLGENMTDESATMYAFSQPGETGKRDLETRDLDSIADLYSEPFSVQETAGCGGATIAGYAGESWIWVALALAGLGLLMRRRSTRDLAASAGAVGAIVLGVGASSSAPADFGDAGWLDTGVGSRVPVTVTGSEAQWRDGMIVTQLSLRPDGQRESIRVQALGGQVGNYVQVVGHALPPAPGHRFEVRLQREIGQGALWLSPVASLD